MSEGYIGTYVCTLHTPYVHSLKEKRSLIKPITEKLKSRFPVAVARLQGLDEHHWERIGVVTISSDYVWVQQTLGMVAQFVAGHSITVADEMQHIQPIEP